MKNRRKRSKANRVLKAAGTAGLVFGAAMIDANVVFAAESDSVAPEGSESDDLGSESHSEFESLLPKEDNGNNENDSLISDGEQSAAENAEIIESDGEEDPGKNNEDTVSEKESASVSR